MPHGGQGGHVLLDGLDGLLAELRGDLLRERAVGCAAQEQHWAQDLRLVRERHSP